MITISQPLKVHFFGNQPESYRFIKQSLIQQEIEFEYHNSDKFDSFNSDIDFDLAIIDFGDHHPQKLNSIFSYLNKLNQNNIPSLALVPENDVRLRYRLAEQGITDYITTPFDKLDIQIRFKNLIQINKQAKQNALSKKPDVTPHNLFQFSALLEQINIPVVNFSFENTILSAIKHFKEILDVQIILYFEVVDEKKIQLKYSVPEYSNEFQFEIPINEFPSVIKTVRLKESIILNQLKSQNQLHTYLKSYLNVDAKSFALYPVIQNENTIALVLALRLNDNKFQETDRKLIEIFMNYIQTSINLKNAQSQLEQQLDGQVWRFSFEFLEHVINQLNFGILVLDKKNKIRYINKPAAHLLQVDFEKILYHPVEDLLGEANTQTIFSFWEETDGTYERPEIEVMNKNGDKILIGFNIMEFEESAEEGGGFIISLKDITYSKELQEEMRRMDRLASLGVMASGIAHEIRNPLAGIKAIAQTFEEELSEDDPKNEFVKRIIRQVNRLDDMLRNLFSYAKPQKADRKFHYIEGILQDVLSLLKQKIQKHDIKLNQSIASNIPPLFIDNSQIQQVLFNLILNSIEAIENKGEIAVSIEPVDKNSSHLNRKPFYRKITENPYVHIHISDNGSGIARENLQQIFNPFFTTKPFGTGLGLSIVYQIVQENSGIIYFESEPEKGTDCYLFLPAFEPETELAQEE